jgi:hypothetical protein
MATKRKRRNPTSSADKKALETAKRLSKRFHGKATEIIELSAKERKLPRYLVALGSMPEVRYKPRKGSKRNGFEWVHESGDKGPMQKKAKKAPFLAVDPKTKRPVIVPVGSPMKFSSARGLIG